MKIDQEAQKSSIIIEREQSILYVKKPAIWEIINAVLHLVKCMRWMKLFSKNVRFGLKDGCNAALIKEKIGIFGRFFRE